MSDLYTFLEIGLSGMFHATTIPHCCSSLTSYRHGEHADQVEEVLPHSTETHQPSRARPSHGHFPPAVSWFFPGGSLFGMVQISHSPSQGQTHLFPGLLSPPMLWLLLPQGHHPCNLRLPSHVYLTSLKS